jgi:hypothetical protein
MQEDHQRCGARTRRQRSRRQRTSRQRTSRLRGQAHVRHVLGPGAVGEHQVWRWCWPGQYVRCQRASQGVYRGDHDMVTAARSLRGHDDTITDEHDHARHSADHSQPDHGQGPITAKPSPVDRDHDRHVATFGYHAPTVTLFTRCTSPGHPLFLDMNVYFPHRAGKLGGGAQGGIEVSSYSGWVMLSALACGQGHALACGQEQLRMSPTNVTRARR